MPHELQTTADDPTVRIDDYLDRVVAPLVNDVPHARRRELRSELGAHLEALVEAHRELGATPDEAVSAALQQFGSPRQVGRQWLREWQRKPLPPASPRHSAFVGLLCFLPASLLAWGANNLAISVGSWATSALLLINTVVFPVAAGLITGFLVRKRHGFGAVLGCGVVAILCALAGALQSVDEIATARQFPLAALAATQAAIWLPLAAAAGALGGSLRRQVRRALNGWAGEAISRWAAE